MKPSLYYSSFDDADFRREVQQFNKYLPKDTTRSPLAWLKKHVSEIDIGEHFKDAPRPVHCNKNERVLEHFAALAAGRRSFLSWQWKWQTINDHCSAVRTCYFAGAGENKKRFTVVKIDVDCKRFGSWEGARKYLEFLRDNYFPGLYFERSTGGKGGHGYFLLEKCDLGAGLLNKLLLDRFAPWLNELAQGFDIELVEIKGTMPVIEWGERKFEALNYKSGMLAKVPRGLVSRFEELKNTTRILAGHLQTLPISERKSATTGESRTIPGSVSGKHFDEETLSGLKEGGRFKVAAETLISCQQMKTSGRSVVTAEDLAIALMIGEWLTKNICANGAMPTSRWAGIWKALFEAEDVQRGWDHKRFAVIRDYLSSLGLIDWEDETYRSGWYDSDGTYVKGKAAKWRFSQELMEQLVEAGGVVEREVADGEVSGISDAIDNKGKERHPLWEQNIPTITNWASSLTQLPENETIRPVEVLPVQLERIDPDFVTQITGYYDTLAA